MPGVGYGAYLLEYLDLLKEGTWLEINELAKAQMVVLSLWESKTLFLMRIEYDNMTFKARKRSCVSPMEVLQSESEEEAQLEGAFSSMRALAKAGATQ